MNGNSKTLKRNSTETSDTYQVKLGYSEVIVEAPNATVALLRARSALRDQSPRLWDVITSLADDRFEVAIVPNTQ
ncbi:MAG: hypothetical protein ACI9G1_001370 [Pirellulaceae bacterium]|jgi:hypothetical protein